MHRLYFDPQEGLIVWLTHAARRLGIARDGRIALLDLARVGATTAFRSAELE